jgi:hypothetical protein
LQIHHGVGVFVGVGFGVIVTGGRKAGVWLGVAVGGVPVIVGVRVIVGVGVFVAVLVEVRVLVAVLV